MAVTPAIAAKKAMGVYYYPQSWREKERVYQELFPDEAVIPMRSHPFYYLERGAKAVESLYIENDSWDPSYSVTPLYTLSPVMVVNRDQTDADIQTWSDLFAFDISVGLEDNSEYLLLGINQGLAKNWRRFEQSMEMLREIKEKGNLLFKGEPGFRFGETPDVIILFDRQARDYEKGRGNFEIIYPTEGTVAFPYALVSRRPLAHTKTVVKNHFEKAGYHTDVDDTPQGKKIDADIYAALIRSESKIERDLRHVFRPFRTNKFENSMTYVLSLMLLSILGLYFYFRISDPLLRRYILFIFILMIFWSILRVVRLLLPDEDTMHRYAWYFYYVALLYIPLLFMWIAVEVDGRWSAVVRSRIKRIGFVVATVLVFLVLTNDLHQWVFQSIDEWATYRFNRLIIEPSEDASETTVRMHPVSEEPTGSSTIPLTDENTEDENDLKDEEQVASTEVTHASPQPAYAEPGKTKEPKTNSGISKWALIGAVAVLLLVFYLFTRGGASDKKPEDQNTAVLVTEDAQEETGVDDAANEDVQEPDTEALVETETVDGESDNAVADNAAAPVSRAPGEVDRAEDLIGDWEGIVLEIGHYGPGYEEDEMMVHDLFAVLDKEEETGKYFFEAYLDGIEDPSPVLSAYISMEEDHFIGEIGEEDAWILDHYLTAEHNGYFYARYEAPTTLSIEYGYEDYDADNAGFHLSFTFRKAGESWNDLPFSPSYMQ